MTEHSSPGSERAAFIEAHRHLDLTEGVDAWLRPIFKHPHIESMWSGWEVKND